MENKMRKRSLNQTLDRAYSYADSNLVELKSAMIGLCIDIERYFKVAFDANLNEKIDDDTFRRILIVFPRFRSFAYVRAKAAVGSDLGRFGFQWFIKSSPA